MPALMSTHAAPALTAPTQIGAGYQDGSVKETYDAHRCLWPRAPRGLDAGAVLAGLGRPAWPRRLPSSVRFS